jgi:phosphatidylglycerophosphate synthase
MSSKTIDKHKRVQESLLAPAERKILLWFAKRMPPFINSDHLTILGLASMAMAGGFYYLAKGDPWFLHLVNIAIVLNWFGDSLDGTLARVRDKLRPKYGYYVDHILDNFGVLFVIIGLALSGFMSQTVAFLFLIVYFLLNINIYLATSSLGVFQISFTKMGPTELRIALIVGNLFLISKPVVHLFGQPFLLFDVGGIVGIGILAVITVVSTLKNTHTLYCMEKM